jgi:hypothetical protein
VLPLRHGSQTRTVGGMRHSRPSMNRMPERPGPGRQRAMLRGCTSSAPARGSGTRALTGNVGCHVPSTTSLAAAMSTDRRTALPSRTRSAVFLDLSRIVIEDEKAVGRHAALPLAEGQKLRRNPRSSSYPCGAVATTHHASLLPSGSRA